MREEIIKKYFWDIDAKNLDLKKAAPFVIERIMESGDETAVRWLFRRYGKKKISEIINKSRRLSPRSRSYWNLISQSWKKKITRKSSAKKLSAIWRF